MCAMFLKTRLLYFILLLAIDKTGQKNINNFNLFFVKHEQEIPIQLCFFCDLQKKKIVSLASM